MAYFGVDRDVRIKELLQGFTKIVRNKKQSAARNLKAIFNEIDVSGNGKVSHEEFEHALACFG